MIPDCQCGQCEHVVLRAIFDMTCLAVVILGWCLIVYRKEREICP